jgi:hypothetical protein
MIYIELTERLKYSSLPEKRKYITSDETWAFTEQPTPDKFSNDHKQIPPCDLFNLFTADIIQANTTFIR